MNSPLQTPFDSVENAQQYVRLLVEAIAEAKSEIEADLGAAVAAKSQRRVQALRIVQFKLDKLEQHLTTRFRPRFERGHTSTQALNFSANFFSNFPSFGEITNMQ